MPVTKLPKKIEAAILFEKMRGLSIGSFAAKVSCAPNASKPEILTKSETRVC